MSATVKMVSQIADENCLYEIYLDNVLVWRRLIEIGRRNYRDRVAMAREQERAASRLARARDPWSELKALRGPGPVAGYVG